MRKKSVLIKFSMLLASSLSFSCSNEAKKEIREGDTVAKMVGIEAYMCEKDDEGKLKAASTQYNFGDCSGKERFVKLYRPIVNEEYYLLIEPVLTGGSTPLMLVGDNAKIEQNEGYAASYYPDYDTTAYKFVFTESGTYRVNISLGSFSTCFDAVVKEASSI